MFMKSLFSLFNLGVNLIYTESVNFYRGNAKYDDMNVHFLRNRSNCS